MLTRLVSLSMVTVSAQTMYTGFGIFQIRTNEDAESDENATSVGIARATEVFSHFACSATARTVSTTSRTVLQGRVRISFSKNSRYSRTLYSSSSGDHDTSIKYSLAKAISATESSNSS